MRNPIINRRDALRRLSICTFGAFSLSASKTIACTESERDPTVSDMRRSHPALFWNKNIVGGEYLKAFMDKNYGLNNWRQGDGTIVEFQDIYDPSKTTAYCACGQFKEREQIKCNVSVQGPYKTIHNVDLIWQQMSLEESVVRLSSLEYLARFKLSSVASPPLVLSIRNPIFKKSMRAYCVATMSDKRGNTDIVISPPLDYFSKSYCVATFIHHVPPIKPLP